MQRISPDLDLRPGSMARTLLETYALTAAMSAPTHDFGTGLFDISQEMEHLELTLAAGLGVNRNGDDFGRVRMSALGIPSLWAPMQVSRIAPRSPSPLWDDRAALGLRPRVSYRSNFPNPFLNSVIDQLNTAIFNPRNLLPRPASAPTGGPVPRMYMDQQTWNDIVHFGGGQEGEFQVPAVRSAVEQRAVLAAQEAQRAREDAHAFALLDQAAAMTAPVLDIAPTRPEPMRLRIPTFEIGRDTPLFTEELARLPAGAPVSLAEVVALEHERIRTEVTQAVDEDILRTLTPHVPLDTLTMTGRFPMAMFPMDPGPTIRLDEIRTRRFNIFGREPVTVPPIPPPKPMTLEQMEKVALVCRRTFWEKLLDDEYAY